MNKIFFIMGKSSVGKDTIYAHLLNSMKDEIYPSIYYTTRPMREGEIDGFTYYFSNKEEFEKMLKNGDIVEFRSYDTICGEWIYFTSSNKIDLINKNYLMIGPINMYNNIKNYYGKDVVIPLYINIDDGIRLTRALKREMNEKKPKYEEMCRRFLSDAKDFQKEEISKIPNVFDNNGKLEDTVENIKKFIEGRLE